MVESLTFRLPDSAQPVRPVLKVIEDISFKDFILSVTFEGSSAATILREDVPEGLFWSTSLERPFVYLPDAKAVCNIRLAQFLPPNGARFATITITPWATTAKRSKWPFSEMVLETRAVGRPAVIIGKEA